MKCDMCHRSTDDTRAYNTVFGRVCMCIKCRANWEKRGGKDADERGLLL